MGIRAQLHEIPASKFGDVKAVGSIDGQLLDDALLGFLDKSWYELHLLFKHMEPPLKYIISGDWQYPSSSPTIEEFAEGKTTDYYFAFASPSLVLQVTAVLAMLSEPELAKIASQINIAYDDYLRHHLEVLKQTYSRAANNGNAISITIA